MRVSKRARFNHSRVQQTGTARVPVITGSQLRNAPGIPSRGEGRPPPSRKSTRQVTQDCKIAANSRL